MTLRTRLDDLAADAPGTDALDLEVLRSRITRRRRGRLAAAGGAVAVTVAAAGTAVATLLPSSDPAEPPVATPAPVQQAFEPGSCGLPATTLGPAPDAPLELTVDLHAPQVRGRLYDLGTVTVTNVSDAVVAGTLRGASTSFTRDGVNVTVNGPAGPQAMPAEHIELQPGESSSVELVTSPDDCDPPPGNGLLPPGRYELYVIWRMQEFTPGNSSGRPIALYSGPITVDLP